MKLLSSRSTTSRFTLAALAVAAALIGAPQIARGQNATSVPKSTLVPVTEFIPELSKSPPNSFSLASADRYLQPLNLSKLGYVEEEYLVSGSANVYDWGADGKIAVKTANAPYTT